MTAHAGDDEQKLGGALFTFDRDGSLRARFDNPTAGAVATEVDLAAEDGRLVVLSGAEEDLPSEARKLLLQPKSWDLSLLEDRVLRTPEIVPDAWTVPTGVRGEVAGFFLSRGRRRSDSKPIPPIVVIRWSATTDEAHLINNQIEERLLTFKLLRPSRVFDLIEGLVDWRRHRGASKVAAVGEGGDDDSVPVRRAGFDEITNDVESWWRDFVLGHDLSSRQRVEIEATMRGLVSQKGRLRPEDEITRTGLESRLSRLLDALASRDAAGSLNQRLGLLTSLVLVPGVIAGIYGSNVAYPLRESRPGWIAMLTAMAAGAGTSYALLALRPTESRGRRIPLTGPGRRVPGERSASAAVARSCALAFLAAMAGIAFAGVVLLEGMDLADAAVSTRTVLWIGAGLTAVGWLSLVAVEIQERGLLRAVASASGSAGFALGCAVLVSDDGYLPPTIMFAGAGVLAVASLLGEIKGAVAA